jgi:hypothetical protein
MRYCDGELSPSETARVRSHLEACWECRSELDRLQQTIAACVEFRRTVLHEHLPPPPEPWKDIYAQMDRIDAALAPPPLWRRALRWLGDVAQPRIAIPAGAAAALLLAVVLFRETPSVQAAELLERAAAAERKAPLAAKRLRIRTRGASFTRVLPAGGPSPVAELFARASYDWSDPLSARSFGAWRDTLDRKDDEVSEDRDGFRILTRAYAGELREASMRLRRDDLHAVQGIFRFRDEEWVEVTELEAGPTLAAASEASAPLASTHDKTNPIEPAVEPASVATDADELKVWALLHRLNADLGEPVEITRAGGKVRVSGVGLADDRRQELTAELAAIPQVEVQFSNPAAAPATPAAARATLRSGESPLAMELERAFGSRAMVDTVGAEALDHADALMARAYALRRLRERFPEGSVSLPSGGAQTLTAIERDHLQALLAHAAQLDQLLGPTLKSLGPAGGLTGGGAADGERTLFAASYGLERSVSMLFGGAESAGEARQLPSRLLARLNQVQTLARRQLSNPGTESRE